MRQELRRRCVGIVGERELPELNGHESSMQAAFEEYELRYFRTDDSKCRSCGIRREGHPRKSQALLGHKGQAILTLI